MNVGQALLGLGRLILVSIGLIRDPDPLVTLILSENHPFGPMPRTGGIVHAVTTAQAREVAGYLRQYAPQFGVRLSLAASVARGEGDFDPDALDPNDQDAKPGETPDQAALHADVGIEQEDVATALGEPAFQGKTILEIEDMLRSPEYGSRFICSVTAGNIDWARKQLVLDPSLAATIPNGDPEVLGVTAYNKGKRGALLYARSSNPDWRYALAILNRAKTWAWLDSPPKGGAISCFGF